MGAMRLAIFMVFAFLPTFIGQAGEVRAKMKTPIQPDEGVIDVKKEAKKRSASPSKTSKPTPPSHLTRSSLKKQAPAAAEIPGYLNFSTFAIGGRVSEPRVNFVLDPIPLEMVDESFALDYHQRVMDDAAKKELGL